MLSRAMIKNLPIAGKSSSGRRLKCGPESCCIADDNSGKSKFNFNCLSQTDTKPLIN